MGDGDGAMDGEAEEPVAPTELRAEAVALIDDLSEAELRATIEYARDRLQFVHPEVTEQIEARDGEEIVRIEDRGAYTEVVKRQPCATGCDECPHEPILYHVTEERQLDGTTDLHWTYLGRVYEG